MSSPLRTKEVSSLSFTNSLSRYVPLSVSLSVLRITDSELRSEARTLEPSDFAEF